jgi:ElaB/YqjD/DUF883 family membrane-anchored ribosome-binding protein
VLAREKHLSMDGVLPRVTIGDRLRRLGQHLDRAAREVGDSIGDLAQDVTDPADNRLEALAREARRNVRDAGQRLGDEAQDAAWALKKALARRRRAGRPFAERFEAWRKSVFGGKRRARRSGSAEAVAEKSADKQPAEEAAEGEEAARELKGGASGEAVSKAEEVIVTKREMQVFTVKRIDDAITNVREAATKAAENVEEFLNEGRERETLGEALAEQLEDAIDAAESFVADAKRKAQEHRRRQEEGQTEQPTIDFEALAKQGKENLEATLRDVDAWIKSSPEEKKASFERTIRNAGTELEDARDRFVKLFKKE